MSEPGAAATAADVRERSLRSVVWVTALQGLVAALYFGVPLALSYLLSPSELGLLELVVSVIGLGVVVVELGTGPAIVQRPDLDRDYASTVFWVNLSSGTLWALVLVLAGPALVRALGTDVRLVSMLRGTALGLVLSALGIVPQALLVRRMEFRRVTYATTLAVLAGLAAAAFGFARHGVYGVIWGFLAFAILNSAALWLASGFRPGWRVQRAEILPLVRFGGSAFSATAGDRLAQQTERLLIAGFLGADSLGLFALARSLIRDPLRRLMSIFDEILFPGLSALQGDKERTRRYYLTAVRFELAIFGPAVVFIAVFARELSELLYGHAWQGVALVAQLLAFHTWRIITSHSIGAVFLSQGRPDVRLRWVVCAIGLVPVYFFVGRPWGLTGYALSLSIVGIVGWVVSHTMANRLIDLGWPRLWRALRAPLVAHLAFTAILIAARLLFADTLVADARWVLVFVVPALVSYTALLAAIDRPLLVGVAKTAWEALGRRPRDARPRSQGARPGGPDALPDSGSP
jgi:lipopolysaccharide exporter